MEVSPFLEQILLMSISSWSEAIALGEQGLSLNESDILVTSHI